MNSYYPESVPRAYPPLLLALAAAILLAILAGELATAITALMAYTTLTLDR